MVRVLNVAEKPSIAKTLSAALSGGRARSRRGVSKYNFCYDFSCRFPLQGFGEQDFDMVVTSVSGHVMGIDFPEAYSQWSNFSPSDLFDAPLVRKVLSPEIEQTLHREAGVCQVLVIWTDNDREGEAIGQEIVDICRQRNPSLLVKRARFSVANEQSLWEALRNLQELNLQSVEAVAARNEIDLRLGAVFTRFQTLELERLFPEIRQGVISFGPCQFPTLGFVVDRAEEIRTFVPEPFWTIHLALPAVDVDMQHDTKNSHSNRGRGVTFEWDRVRLFDHLTCTVLFEMCVEAKEGVITSVQRRNKSKWRPLPLSTVELQVRMSKFFRMASEVTMATAEKLYQRGYISYPRTETDMFDPSFDLQGLVNMQRPSPVWGQYAANLVDSGQFQWPRNGRNNDQAHPPIHPTAFVDLSSLENMEQRKVYEFVVRHFLACCSQDAQGSETTIHAEMGGEGFHCRGLEVLARNYLDVYTYDRWGERNLPNFSQGDVFEPAELEMRESTTQPPNYLTEVDLIRLMDRNGIGTDATIQDHINTIQKRKYATKRNNFFIPEPLGYSLILGYKRVGHEKSISKPDMRAAMERGFVDICQGRKTRQQVVTETLELFKRIYHSTIAQAQTLYQEIANNLAMINDFQAQAVLNQGIQEGGDDGADGGGGGVAQIQMPSVEDRIKDFKRKKRGFSHCGACGTATLDLRQQSRPGPPGPRGGRTTITQSLLHCTGCDGLFRLPAGKPTPTEHRCVLCQFQVVSIEKEAGSSYHVCPKCYNSKPPIGDLEDAPVKLGVPCFKCCEPTCGLAGGVKGSSQSIMPCLACTGGSLFLKRSKKGTFMLSCNKYPECKDGTVWAAEKAVQAEVSQQQCPQCRTTLLDMTFKPGSLGPGQPPKQLVCPKPTCGHNEVHLDQVFRFPSLGGPKRAPDQQYQEARRVRHHSTASSNSSSTYPPVPAPQHSSSQAYPPVPAPQSSQYGFVPPPSHYVAPALGFATSTSPKGFHQPNSSSNVAPTTQGSEPPVCDVHRLPCTQFRSSKKNENEGRYFFKCSLPQGQACRFFKWADETGSQQPHPSSSFSSSATSAGGECFNCGQQGHFANACPHPKNPSGSGTRSSGGRNCFNCGGSGHFAKECTSASSQSQRNNNNCCNKCGRHGHLANFCPQSSASTSHCFRCKQRGHQANQCPMGCRQ